MKTKMKSIGAILLIAVGSIAIADNKLPESKIHGLAYGPFTAINQDPNLGSIVSKKQLEDQLKAMSPFTQWVRTYGSTHGLNLVPALAKTKGLKVAQGAWISSDLNANAHELNSLVGLAKSGKVDIAVIGNEVLLRDDLPVNRLIAYIKAFKKRVPNVKVAYADTSTMLVQNSQLIDAVDIVFLNRVSNVAGYCYSKCYRYIGYALP